MNAAQYYKFFLNLSPAILSRHMLLFGVFSKAQGNPQTQQAQPKAPLYKPCGAHMATVHGEQPEHSSSWWLFESHLKTRSKQCQRFERLNTQQVKGYLFCYLDRKGVLKEIIGGAVTQTVN